MPRTQRENAHILVSNPEKDPKTGRASSTLSAEKRPHQRGKEGRRPVRSQTDLGPLCGRDGPTSAEAGDRPTVIPGSPREEEESPQHLALKPREAEFQEFLQPTGLKTWN